MKKLIILRGAPGSGKSSFIAKHGLSGYTLSTDDLRIQFAYSYTGQTELVSIPGKYNTEMFSLLHCILRLRMKYGLFSVVDATHTTPEEINQYKNYAKRYGYKVIVVDRMYNNMSSNPIPSWVEVIKPEDFKMD